MGTVVAGAVARPLLSLTKALEPFEFFICASFQPVLEIFVSLLCHLLPKFFRSPAALTRGNSTDPTLSVMKNLPCFTGLVQARNGLDRADGPWDVDNRVHTNTQYLFREPGRGRLIRDQLNHRGVQKVTGNIKLNPLRMKPEAYSCTPMYCVTIYSRM